MLSLVTAAEHQYRLETAQRDREHRLLVAMRERAEFDKVAAQAAPAVRYARPVHTPTARPRAAWARPIGARLAAQDDCDTVCVA